MTSEADKMANMQCNQQHDELIVSDLQYKTSTKDTHLHTYSQESWQPHYHIILVILQHNSSVI